MYFTNNQLRFINGAFEETSDDGTVRHVTLAGISSTISGPPMVDKTEEVFEESEGMRGIRRDGNYGFVDAKGRLRIANRYEGIGTFRDGLAPVMILGKWGFVDKETKSQSIQTSNRSLASAVASLSFEEVIRRVSSTSKVNSCYHSATIRSGVSDHH
ncbi:MAG: WG repeat-containing protein [Bacteroidota bacterium]